MPRRSDTDLDPEHFALLARAYEALAQHSSEVASFLRSNQVNRVLLSGLVVLGADGTWTPETGFVVPYAAISVYNHHATDAVYVLSSQPTATLPTLTAPGPGRFEQGVQRVDAKTTRQFPMTGTQLSIMGTAGTVVSLAVSSSLASAEQAV